MTDAMGARMPAVKSAADLALSGLTKAYGDAKAVDGLTLRVPAGDLVALLGPSGCGKTTTLRMIAGLVEPTDGQVLVGGTRLTNTPVHRRNIGMLFQSYALFPHLTIAQNIAFGLQMRGLGRRVIGEKVAAVLELVKLSAYADRHPPALSGGQQQRVALARAVVIEPSLLLLDEPLGALDKNLREEMQVEIRQIQRRLGITTVLVTHDQEEALTMADTVVIMRNGKLEQAGTPQEVYSRPKNRFVASFMGISNLMEGDPVEVRGAKTVLRLKCGGRLLVRTGATSQMPAVVSVRPECIHLHDADGSTVNPENGVTGTIEQIIYKGQLTQVHIRLGDDSKFIASVGARAADRIVGIEPGKRVHASWDTVDNHLLEEFAS